MLMKNDHILRILSNIANEASMKVDTAIQQTVLESLLNIYFRVRGHSYARTVVDKSKVASTKKKALRKEIKRALIYLLFTFAIKIIQKNLKETQLKLHTYKT